MFKGNGSEKLKDNPKFHSKKDFFQRKNQHGTRQLSIFPLPTTLPIIHFSDYKLFNIIFCTYKSIRSFRIDLIFSSSTWCNKWAELWNGNDSICYVFLPTFTPLLIVCYIFSNESMNIFCDEWNLVFYSDLAVVINPSVIKWKVTFMCKSPRAPLKAN